MKFDFERIYWGMRKKPNWNKIVIKFIYKKSSTSAASAKTKYTKCEQ